MLWTLGWEQLVREERHKLCIGLATDRMEVIAGTHAYAYPYLRLLCRIIL